MAQQFDWNSVAYEDSPYSDLYSDQPRIYMFKGAARLDQVFLILTALLTFFWLPFLIKSEPGLTKALVGVTVSQIFVNLLVRIFKMAVLLLVDYPQLSWLFIASSVETTFHYTLYLQYTSSVLLYVFLRERQLRSSWTTFYYLPSVIFALLISGLNVNFNKLLHSIPFYLYVIFYVGMAVSNVFILVAVLASCTKFAREKLGTRCRLFLFVLIASPPVLFTTVITIMDLLFMIVGVSEQFPIPYIVMTSYRYTAFEVTPIFFMVAFFALIPDLKKLSPVTTTSEVIPISTEPTRIQSMTTSPETSVAPPEPLVIPGQVPQTTVTPTYSNPNYNGGASPYGALVVHIQPISA